jgi:hypothetical protein
VPLRDSLVRESDIFFRMAGKWDWRASDFYFPRRVLVVQYSVHTRVLVRLPQDPCFKIPHSSGFLGRGCYIVGYLALFLNLKFWYMYML